MKKVILTAAAILGFQVQVNAMTADEVAGQERQLAFIASLENKANAERAEIYSVMQTINNAKVDKTGRLWLSLPVGGASWVTTAGTGVKAYSVVINRGTAELLAKVKASPVKIAIGGVVLAGGDLYSAYQGYKLNVTGIEIETLTAKLEILKQNNDATLAALQVARAKVGSSLQGLDVNTTGSSTVVPVLTGK